MEEQVEIRSGFLATRTQLPVMVIITPHDRKSSIWTQDGPSPQVQSLLCPQMYGFLPQEKRDVINTDLSDVSTPQILQQLVILAAEALPVLEKQLMDPRGPGDIRVSP